MSFFLRKMRKNLETLVLCWDYCPHCGQKTRDSSKFQNLQLIPVLLLCFSCIWLTRSMDCFIATHQYENRKPDTLLMVNYLGLLSILRKILGKTMPDGRPETDVFLVDEIHWTHSKSANFTEILLWIQWIYKHELTECTVNLCIRWKRNPLISMKSADLT